MLFCFLEIMIFFVLNFFLVIIVENVKFFEFVLIMYVCFNNDINLVDIVVF